MSLLSMVFKAMINCIVNKKVMLMILLGHTVITYAQIPQGTISFGLDAGLSITGNSYKSYHNNVFRTELYPNINYFTSDNKMIGLMAGVNYQINSYPGSRSTVFGQYFGIVTRRYFTNNTNRYGFFISEILSYEKRIINTGYSFNSITRVLQLAFKPGVYVFLNDKLALEISFSELYFNNYLNSKTFSYAFNLSSSSLQLGLKYYMNFSTPKTLDPIRRKASKFDN